MLNGCISNNNKEIRRDKKGIQYIIHINSKQGTPANAALEIPRDLLRIHTRDTLKQLKEITTYNDI